MPSLLAPYVSICLLSVIIFWGALVGARQAGPYIIDESCYQLTRGDTTYGALLEQDLRDLRSNLKDKVRLDLADNVHGSSAFRAFFKLHESAEFVRRTFERIHLGPKLVWDEYHEPSPIEIVCLPSKNPEDEPYRQACLDSPLSAMLYNMVYPPKIWTCPRAFVDWVPAAPQHASCPVLDKSGRMKFPRDGLAGPEGILPLSANRQTTLLHELAHFYNEFGINIPYDEIYDAQACAELPEGRQLMNMNNYALYYAGKPFRFLAYFLY